METIDDDIAARSVEYIEKQHKDGKPFFVWVNFTHMHFRTHPKPESVGQAGRWLGPYADVMIDHDKKRQVSQSIRFWKQCKKFQVVANKNLSQKNTIKSLLIN